MQPGSNGLPISQRSEFGRAMAAKRTSGADRSAVGDTYTLTQPRSCLALPVIRQSQDKAMSANGVSSAPHANPLMRSSDVAGFPSSNSASSSAPYVITAKTSRGELLAIITQLQADLARRTDSVNAIQRNFERLSAMHHAEQFELQRLRLLEKTRSADETRGSRDAEHQQWESVLEEMRHKACVQQTSYTLLEEKLQVMSVLCSLQKNTQQLTASHADGFRGIVQAEAAAYAQLYASAMAERTAIGVEHDARHQQMLCKELTQLAVGHYTQIAQHLARGPLIDGQRVLEAAVPASIPAAQELVRQRLLDAAEEVREYIAATNAAAEQERARNEAEHQRVREELGRTLGEIPSLRLRAIEEAESGSRSALIFGALQLLTVTHRTFLDGCLMCAKTEAAASLVSSSFETMSALLTRRVSDWCDAAGTQLDNFCHTIEFSMNENARVFAGKWQDNVQELLCAERERSQDLRKTETLAMEADWSKKHDAVQRAHAVQLMQVRSDLTAQLEASENRRVAAELQSRTNEAALIRAKSDYAAEVRALEAHWQSSISDAVRRCEERWTRALEEYQERQNARTGAVVQLLDDLLLTRLRCVCEEEDARADLYRNHWKNQVQGLRNEHAATMQYCVTSAVCFERIQHHEQGEAASRAVLYAAAATDWAALLNSEVVHRAQAHHALAMSTAAARLGGVRAEAAEHEGKWRQKIAALEADVQQANAERVAAVNRASDAVAAAREAQATLQRTQKDFAAYRSGVTATAQRIEVAENATESACCCPLCLKLYSQPLACVPCGHIYCANCLLRHARNRSLSSLTSSSASRVGASTQEEDGAGTRSELEVAQWLHGRFTSHSRLFCPECTSANVSTVVELQAFGELTAKYDYKRRNLSMLLTELR
ncbi:hypothetical protein JKF63_07537 [Porcisia hertigi]|uniref:RING-type domain-containing protein n=1 Tax=Porcisia hertigi TaxID=2761500 RepID=A0A836I1Z1_9TRYP|nr:hypothetical protein JKF63_07537 [Porcisia hertigi]